MTTGEKTFRARAQRSSFLAPALLLQPTFLGLFCLIGLATIGLGSSSTNPIQIVEWLETNGTQHLGDRAFLGTTKVSAITNAFLAWPAESWAPGLIPIYATERAGRFELHRLPKRGEENQSEPLFFALPPADEPPATLLTGQWHCSATRGESTDSWFIWQLTAVGGTVVGRFDPSSDYRVASIRPGTLRSNRFELVVEYINDTYHLKGEWKDDRLRGTWEKHDREERGQWRAERDTKAVPMPASVDLVELYEWRRTPEGPAHYSTSTHPPSPGWTRSPEPLGRVRKHPTSNSPSPQAVPSLQP